MVDSMKLLDTFAHFIREEIDIDTVFGIPGIHNLDFFDAFQNAGFKIFTSAHEQGAAFMADGYARSTGRAAICLVIDGPGFLNAATAIAQAHADSVPILVVSPVHAEDRNLNGRLHELTNQELIASQICSNSYVLSSSEDFKSVCSDIAYRFSTGRPRPVHVQLPLDETDISTTSKFKSCIGSTDASELNSSKIASASALLNSAEKPLMVVGGGGISAREEILETAEFLDAPCVNTVNGKGIVPVEHPLHVGGSPSMPAIQQALYDADAVLAVGTEFGETDFGFFLDYPLQSLSNLVRVDIDNDQLNKNQVPTVSLHGSVATVLPKLELQAKNRNGSNRAQALKRALLQERYVSHEYREFLGCLMCNSDVVVGDSCQPTYHASWSIEPNEPRSYFHSVTGFGTLGYALPASIGAKLGNPNKRVVSLIGDGGLLYTLSEMHTAMRYRLALPIVVWNNNGYEEIEKATQAHPGEFQCPSMHALDYQEIARGFKVAFSSPTDLSSLQTSLSQAYEKAWPTLIQVNQADFVKTEIGNWYA